MQLNLQLVEFVNLVRAFLSGCRVHSALADCYILKYFLLNIVQSHHGLRGDFGHTNIYMVFQSNTASRIQNYIVCDLLWT